MRVTTNRGGRPLRNPCTPPCGPLRHPMTWPKAMTLLALWVCFPLLLDTNVNLCESEFVDAVIGLQR